MKNLFHQAGVGGEVVRPCRTLADFQAVRGASSLEALGREVGLIVRALGFQYYLYGMRYAPPEGESCQFILSGYPSDWMPRYLAAGYAEIDPVLAHIFLHASPLVWSEAMYDTPERRAFMLDARAHGVASGISVPISGLPSEMGLVSFANPGPTPEERLHSVQTSGTAYVLASYMHEAVRRLVLAPMQPDTAAPALTPRERECLRWWANGKTAEQIAGLMHITVAGVRFHMHNLKRKLGVRTKHQAISRAVLLRLVSV